MPRTRIIAHVDLDAFFASVEEREDPSLRGKPVIIGADPMGGRGRGIVATCSYAARKFGVHSAMPISIAWRQCPQGVYLRPRFSLYSEASRKVMDILRPKADVFEQAGIDEAYLDLSSQETFEKARDVARALKAEVREKEGLSVTVGIGPNKLVAKTASDHKKPDGLTVVIPKRVQEFLDPKGVGALYGVGPKTRERLNELGYDTVASLRTADEKKLVSELGKFGSFLWHEARGEDERALESSWETKSMGREHTFGVDTGDWDEVGRTLDECVADVVEQMREEGVWCRTLTLKIRFEGYETHSRQTTLKGASGRLDQLTQGARNLLEAFRSKGKKIRLVGFSASNFSQPEELLPFPT